MESLETKLAKVKAEWESSKLAHEATLAEFEGYKVWVMDCFCAPGLVYVIELGGGVG